jgi:hypothetical protein
LRLANRKAKKAVLETAGVVTIGALFGPGGVRQWVADNWFNLTSTIGIVGSLLFTAFSLHSETKTRRIANLLAITANYRDVWKEFLNHPELVRVIDPKADVSQQPVTPAEETFVNMVISHTSSVHEALEDELLTKQEGLKRDVKVFFSLPIPKAVWIKSKLLQNQDFAAYIDSSLKQL